jgi:hypothetical protein
MEVLQRIWQTKMSSISLLEVANGDHGRRDQAGLGNQLVDERRHARMIGEQIRRRRRAHNAQLPKDAVTRVFDEAVADRDDLRRLLALYPGHQAYTIDRCSHIIPYADSALGQVLEALSRDEERHLRWADLRLQRLLSYERMRECNLLVGRVQSQLETAWLKQWRHLSMSVLGKRGA